MPTTQVTKISCHFQAKTVQLFFFFFFTIYEKRKWVETLIKFQFTAFEGSFQVKCPHSSFKDPSGSFQEVFHFDNINGP